MNIIELLKAELEQESVTTRKMLTIVPDDKYDWKPHPKSMNVHSLATHIAELLSWVDLAVTTDELDFAANPYAPEDINNNAQLLDLFERTISSARKHLDMATLPLLEEKWTLRSGDTIYGVMSKYDVIRHTYCQVVHHRAQLGVFLRLLDIPIPGSYGPSADEMM